MGMTLLISIPDDGCGTAYHCWPTLLLTWKDRHATG